MPPKKKVIKKVVKKVSKNPFNVINTETKTFKDGRKLNIVSYGAPDANPNDIYKFINRKSKLMAKSDKFKNATLNLMIKFGSGWRSVAFQNAGSIFEYLLDYADMEDFDDTISEFRIGFIV